jgi:hypothetical protein
MTPAERVRDHVALWLTKQVRDEQKIIDRELSPKVLDAPLLARHPLHPPWLHSLPRTIAQGYTANGGELFNFAHFCIKISAGFLTPRLSLIKRAGIVIKAIGTRVSSLMTPYVQSEAQV